MYCRIHSRSSWVFLILWFAAVAFGLNAKSNAAPKSLTAAQKKQVAAAEKLAEKAQKQYDDGKLREAIATMERALAIRKEAIGEDHEEYASGQHDIANVYFELDDYKAALPYAEKSLELRRKVLGEEHADTALSYHDVGYLRMELYQHNAAREPLEMALKLRRKLLGDEHEDTIMSYDSLGKLFYNMGKFSLARDHYSETLRLTIKLRGEEHEETANLRAAYGFVLYNLGNYEPAREQIEKGLNLRKKIHGEEHVDTAISYNDLGLLFHGTGDFAAARANYEQALKIYQKVLGEEDVAQVETLSNLGLLLQDQGDYKAAKPYFERGIQIKKAANGEDEPDYAMLLNNLGLLLQDLEDYDGARPLFEQALAILKKAYGEDHFDVALLLNNLGLLHYQLREFDKAFPYYNAALKGYQRAVGDEHPNTAVALNNLALLHSEKGDNIAARPYYELALKVREKLLGDQHPDTGVTLDALAAMEVLLGNWEVAYKLTDRARRGMRQHTARVLPSLSEKEQLTFLEIRDKDAYFRALSVGHARLSDPVVAELSAGWVLNGKGVAQESLAAQTLLARDEKDPATQKAAQRLLEIRRELATLSLATAKKGEEGERKKAIEELTAEEAATSRQVVQQGKIKPIRNAWVEVAELRNALPAQSAFIDIASFRIFDFKATGDQQLWSDEHYVAWVIPAGKNSKIQMVDLGTVEVIDAAIEKTRGQIAGAVQEDSTLRKEGESAAEKQVRESLQAVADLVWKPLADKIGNAQQLIISPDGALWLLPWGALPHTNEKCLLEKYPLSYVVSGRDIVNPANSSQKTSSPALFADPDFDLSPSKTRQSIQAIFPNLKLDGNPQTRSLSAKSALPAVMRLPNTARELQAITPSIARLTNTQPQTFLDRYALESVFKRVERPSFLVLSTHGFFLSDQHVKQDAQRLTSHDAHSALLTVDGQLIENPLLRCGLLLAGCNTKQSTAGDDGILTGMEIVGIDLRGTQLVVLSACETGVGKVRNGEGVVGLRQAFQLAGAKSVVATLWQVPDVDSSRIMTDFFQNLADGQTKADALRNAQIKRIQARRDKFGAAHPLFWAAWTLTGE